MEIGEAVRQAHEGTTKQVEVALNARRLVDRRLTEVDTYENEVLCAGAVEILNFQVGNGRYQTPFMLSVFAYLRRRGTITYRQAAAVINVMFDEANKGQEQARPSRPAEVPYGTYKCTIRACPRYGVEFEAMLPSHHRIAVGSPIRCWSCGDAVVLTGVVHPEAVPA